MRYTTASLVCTLLMTVSSMASANSLTCANKQRDIEQQIAHAKEHGQDKRIAALETALANNKANCTDEKLLEEQQKTVKEKEAKVEKATKKLEEAKAKGKPEKIKERTKELEKAQKALAKESALLPAK